ncbi:MAG: hypothetical protein IKE65_09810 [Clostridia bacterium]|nr:hypothetical protein [Clostridia bacterium]
MKAKKITRRAISVMLCVAMLFSCWVFVAPTEASAATAGNYKYKLNINTTDSVDVGDDKDLTLTLNYKKNNGTGSSGSVEGTANYKWAEENGSHDYEDWTAVPGFVTSVDVTVIYAWTAIGTRKWGCTLTLYVYNNNNSSWVQVASKSYAESGSAWGQTTKTYTLEPDAAAYPYINSIGAIGGGANSINVPTAAGGSTTSAAFTGGTVKDQYGVNWYQDATLSCTPDNGVTWANNKLTVTNSCNRADDYIITINQKCGSVTGSKDVTIKTFDYNVAFKNEDGSADIYTDSFDYGAFAEYRGDTPTKSDSVNPPKYAYTFTGWSETPGGALIESFPEMTGGQNKTYYANFSSETIPYTVKFVDKDGNTLGTPTDYIIGDLISAPADPAGYITDDKIYTFDSWVGTNGEAYTGKCTGAVTYQPRYTSVDREYTVTFKNYDGFVLGTADFKWHEQIVVPDNIVPEKPADGQEYESWTFTGWYPEITSETVVTGDNMEFVAQFEGTKKPYTVRFVDEAGENITAPQTLYWGDMPTEPTGMTKESTAQYDYEFAGWDHPVVAVNGDAIYVVQFSETVRTYTITFTEADGTVIATVENQPYGTVPEGQDYVPEVIGMLADDEHHYEATWEPAINTPITGDATYKNVYLFTPHTYTDWNTDKAPTCEGKGSESRYCLVCEYVQDRDIDPTGHDMILKSHAPSDGNPGSLYYECGNGCGKFATCVLDESGNAQVGEICAEEPIEGDTLPVPTTDFNTYSSTEYGYDYSTRGAQLRIVEDEGEEVNDIQPIRFIGSMTLPEGVEIVDFGYIYLREDAFRTMDRFVIGGKNVEQKSAMDGRYTDHRTETGTVRTFNLVIQANRASWSYNFIARPYIIYRFAGELYTVYDSMYAYRSVEYIANCVMQNPNEPAWVKEYVQNRILNVL